MTATYSFNPAADNPLSGINRGARYAPAFADLDGDGDLDLVVGWTERAIGKIRYYENTGNPATPTFARRTGEANPFNGIHLEFGQRPVPVLADMDADGDVDLAFGDKGGDINYYENTGARAAPTFERRTGAANPFNGIDVNSSVDDGYSAPALGDLDGDGDLDLVVGGGDGIIRYYRNTGNAAAPAFTQQAAAANPFNGIDVGDDAKPTLLDLDGDGNLDLVAGDKNGMLHYYRNTGSATAPRFAERTGAANPFDGINDGSYAAPAFADLDNDGALELAFGNNRGGLKYADGAIDWLVRQVLHDEAGRTISITWLDYRQEADLFGGVVVSDNPANPKDYFAPAFADLDGDGDLDLLVGKGNGAFDYYRNTGSATAPTFEPGTGAANPLNGVIASAYAVPAFADLDGDGDLDLLVGKKNGFFNYYKNTGNATTPIFERQLDAANPMDGIDVGNYAAPAFADLDGDGDLDLLVGEWDGAFAYYRNTGSATAPVFTQQAGAANPLNGIDAGSHAAPAFADLDGDGDLDLLAGHRNGDFVYFENTGAAATPAFSRRTLLSGFDVEDDAKPALADLDGDGSLEIVTGGRGQFHHYRLTATARETYAYDEAGALARAERESYTYNKGAEVVRTDFDADADGTVDRVESYTRSADGSLTHTRYDDDADGLYDRYTHWGADGTSDITSSFQRNGNGQLTGYDTDRDGDGAADGSVRIARNAAGYRIQLSATATDSAAGRSLSYYDETGFRLATGDDRTDEDRDLDSFSYTTTVNLTSEIRASVEQATVGLVDANDLVGIPLVTLAGADIGSTDLTISDEALAVLAGGDDGYQLQIDGDREDALRFEMDDFTEGATVDVDGEAYRQFQGTTGSFIVDPDVVVLDLGESRPALNATGANTLDDQGRVIRTDFDDTGDGYVDRSNFDPNGDGTVDRSESYTRNAEGVVTHTRFDDDHDGLYDRYEEDRNEDGTVDAIISYQYDENGRRVDINRDWNGDGAVDANIHIVRDTAGVRIQVSNTPPGSTAPRSINYFNEAGDRLATSRDSNDPDLVQDYFFYSTLLDGTSEIRPSVAVATVGLVDANDLEGISQIVLAGSDTDRADFTLSLFDDPLKVLADASIGSTDLTISDAALAVLAGGDDEYQLRIDGGWEDTLRFDMADFTRGATVDVDGEAYLQFAGTTGSFIVDPDVALISV